MLMGFYMHNRTSEHLKKAGISIYELQKRSNLPWTTCYRIATESRLHTATHVGTLARVAKALEIELDSLVELREEQD